MQAQAPAATDPNPSCMLATRSAGRVRVWDATTQVPEMLLTIPAAAGQERLRAVTALEVGQVFTGKAACWHLLDIAEQDLTSACFTYSFALCRT